MIKILKTERDGNYEYKPFKEFYEQNDIIQEIRLS